MPLIAERDPSLRRIQRDAGLICAVTATAALILERGRPDGALGVLAGTGLMAMSYWAISSGVTAMVDRAAATSQSSPGKPVSRRRVIWTLARFLGRWIVFGVAAWVVLVPLRAHPLGLFAGVTASVAAIAVEAVRLATRRDRRG